MEQLRKNGLYELVEKEHTVIVIEM